MGNTSWPPRVALITGAASGLGRQLAVRLASEGVAIAAVDLQADGLQSLQRELEAKGTKCAWEIADVTDVGAVQRAANVLEAKLGPVDLLIACAGIGYETPTYALEPNKFNAIINVNLIGVSNTIAAVLPGMLARRKGHIAAISSLASYRGLPMMAAYCAAKSGVNAIFESLRVEVGPRGIGTTLVCPGWIRTPLTDKINLKVPMMLDVDYAAKRIIKAIRKRRKFVAFPWASRGPLAVLRLLPLGISDWMITRMMQKLRG
ncbi:MAG TPA: SDR family NAD(P)-dependent oxidoreductase [Gemmataceae bacterium]|nr:SDR family NAD(P)-dependent oxidoreductase [Gemmataceae bacterium]